MLVLQCHVGLCYGWTSKQWTWVKSKMVNNNFLLTNRLFGSTPVWVCWVTSRFLHPFAQRGVPVTQQVGRVQLMSSLHGTCQSLASEWAASLPLQLLTPFNKIQRVFLTLRSNAKRQQNLTFWTVFGVNDYIFKYSVYNIYLAYNNFQVRKRRCWYYNFTGKPSVTSTAVICWGYINAS